MTQIVVLATIIIAITIGVTMYLDQVGSSVDNTTIRSTTSGSADLTPGSGIGNLLDSAHGAADQLQPIGLDDL